MRRLLGVCLLLALAGPTRGGLGWQDFRTLGRMGQRLSELKAGFAADLLLTLELPRVQASRELRLEVSRGLQPGMRMVLRGPRPGLELLVDEEALWMTVRPRGQPSRAFALRVEGKLPPVDRRRKRQGAGLRRIPMGFRARGRSAPGERWRFEVHHDRSYRLADLELAVDDGRRYRLDVLELGADSPRLSRPVSTQPFEPLGAGELEELPELIRALLGVDGEEEPLADLEQRVRRLRGALDRSWKQENRRRRLGH